MQVRRILLSENIHNLTASRIVLLKIANQNCPIIFLGDQLARKDMSDAQKEVLGTILTDVYDNFVETIANDRGKSVDQVEKFLDSGEYVVDKLVDEGYITGAKYYDELEKSFEARTSGRNKYNWVGPKKLVSSSKVSIERLSDVEIDKEDKKKPSMPPKIAILRASGAISRGSGGNGIKSDDFVKEIKRVRKMKNIDAVILRIDSPGGDALASDLMWRELRLLARERPVIASMSDVAASGGYYMSMACTRIVAEKLTLTGSIGFV